MKFKYYRGFGLSYEEIGLIYFTCLGYPAASMTTRERIERLCQAVGGSHAPALLEAVTTSKGLAEVASKYYLATNTLWRLCKAFYKAYSENEKLEVVDDLFVL